MKISFEGNVFGAAGHTKRTLEQERYLYRCVETVTGLTEDGV